MQVPPALGVRAARVGAGVEEGGPFAVVERGRVGRAGDVGLAAIAELDFRAGAAMRAGDQQHQCATAAAAASSISRPVRKRSSENGALIGCGARVAMVCAKTWPERGVALTPPVPQPQLTNRPGTSVAPMIGERSGVTSTTPPQLRSMRIRRKLGNSSQIASSVWVAMWRPPAWV